MNTIDVAIFASAVAEFSLAVGAFGEIAGMQAENQQREREGHSPAWTGDAFEEVLTRYRMKQP